MRTPLPFFVLLVALGTPFPASAEEPPSPVAAMQRFEVKVLYWEGTFGSFLLPQPGTVLVVRRGPLRPGAPTRRA